MTKLSLIVLGLFVSSQIGAVTTQRGEDFKIIFEGSVKCKTGNVKLSSGRLAKQEFSSLNDAQTALSRVYVRQGVAEFVGLLKNACEEDWKDKLTPFELGLQGEGGATAERRKPGSLIMFVKKEDLVSFKVFGFDSELPAAAVARGYAERRDKKRCRKISSTCWKCPDGIICGISQIAK